MNVVETPMGISVIGILVLLVLLGILVGGVVLVGVLLSNRHTRGFTLFALAAGGVLFVMAAMLLWVRTSSLQKTEAQVAKSQWMADIETQRAADAQMQAEFQRQFKADEDTQVLQFVPDSEEAIAGGAIVHHDKARLFLAPVGLIVLFVFTGVVFLAFKQGGPAIGALVLVLPIAAVFGYFSLGRSYKVVNANDTAVERPIIVPDPAFHHESGNPSYKIDVTNSESDASDSVDEKTKEVIEKSKDTKPEWITAPPKRVGNVYRRVLQAGPYATVDECQQRIGAKIESAVKKYIGEMADAEMHGRASHPPYSRLGVSPRYVRDNLVREEHYETVVSSVSDDMKTLYVLFEVDAQAHDFLMEKWRAYERKERVAVVAVGSGGLLAALAGVLGLIKLDTYTKGYYTKRLFIGVPLAIIGVFLLLTMLN